MELKKIEREEYDRLAAAEPDAGFFQSSRYGEYIADKNSHLLFVAGYDHQLVCALAMFIVRKDSLFARGYSAYSPCGFLMNFYDEDVLREFHHELKKFLSSHKINKIILEPQVRADFSRIGKELVSLGYKQSESMKQYEISLKNYQSDDDFDGLSIEFIEEDGIPEEISERPGVHRYLDLQRNFPEVKTISAYLDIENSRQKISDTGKSQQYLHFLDSQEENRIPLSCIAFIDYEKRCDLLFAEELNNDSPIDGKKLILDHLCKKLIEKKYKKFYSLQCSGKLDENEMIGRFTCSI